MLKYDMIAKKFLGVFLCCSLAQLTLAMEWQKDSVINDSTSIMQSWATMPNAEHLDGFSGDAGDSTTRYLPVSLSIKDITKAYRLISGERLSVLDEQDRNAILEDTMQYNVEMISGGGVRMNLQFRF